MPVLTKNEDSSPIKKILQCCQCNQPTLKGVWTRSKQYLLYCDEHITPHLSDLGKLIDSERSYPLVFFNGVFIIPEDFFTEKIIETGNQYQFVT
jgi:hypothetical protein